jgi:outer membrane protein assembly factor BamB
LTCYDAKTGKLVYEEKIAGANGVTASSIASNGKIYFTTEKGTVFVIKAGEKFELISKNPLNETIMASPAISGDLLFFRTQYHLIAVGK